ncbi:MAG: PEP-CTERM sorting domain-containing protein, partial [Verrucomicrobiales bacterium]
MVPPVYSWTCIVFGLWLTAASLPGAVNLIVNSEFEAGTTGWSQTGTVFTTGQTAILSDQGGSRVVLFQSVAVPVETTLALTLSFDFFNAMSPVVGLGQTPDTVFCSAYIGGDEFGSSYEQGIYDQAIGLLDADYRGSTNLALGLVVTASPKGAGWSRHILSLPVAAHVTVGFEFIDGNALIGDSSGAIDNVYLLADPIPEPSAIGLMLAAASLLLRRRRRPQALGLRRASPLFAAPAADPLQRSPPRLARRLVRVAMVGIALVAAAVLHAEDPVAPLLDPGLVRATAKAERSTLDRVTGELVSTVDLEVVNIGTRRIDGPVHALVRFRNPA